MPVDLRWFFVRALLLRVARDVYVACGLGALQAAAWLTARAR